ncbi:glutamyl-tRNA reductase [Phytomonospora sp. NPDC050363]|uniref:glutamyl-tRNA reductase n=1 Tax=Phytomonospora sp. NPDC050363 TaxID=3155642 RepID=UPI0033EAB02D
MNLLAIGASHRTAPVPLLERLAVTPDELPGLLNELLARPHVAEAVILSTCNRVEIYAAVSGFHAGLSDIAGVLSAHSGTDVNELAEHMYVRHGADAVDHAFTVASGMDSMVLGETQIIGQLRTAYENARAHEAAGRALHDLMQQALRVGKRTHNETGIDERGRSVVSAALELGAGRAGIDVAGASALVIGAGAMGALTLATLRRNGAGPLHVANRGLARAQRLAEAYEATAVPFDALRAALADVDIVVSATASTGHVLHAADFSERVSSKPQLILDLAVPRDVDADVADLPGITVLDMAGLSEALHAHDGGASASAEAEARAIIDAEVAAFTGRLRSAEVAPTVAALRGRADQVMEAELERLANKCPHMTDEQRAEVRHTVHRVVGQLLHQPSVRVRQLAAEPGGEQYAAALRELFALDVAGLSAVSDHTTAEALQVTADDAFDSADLPAGSPVRHGVGLR